MHEGDAEPERQGGILLPHGLTARDLLDADTARQMTAKRELDSARQEPYSEGGDEYPDLLRTFLQDEGDALPKMKSSEESHKR